VVSGFYNSNFAVLWEDSASATSGTLMLSDSANADLIVKDNVVENEEIIYELMEE